MLGDLILEFIYIEVFLLRGSTTVLEAQMEPIRFVAVCNQDARIRSECQLRKKARFYSRYRRGNFQRMAMLEQIFVQELI